MERTEHGQEFGQNGVPTVDGVPDGAPSLLEQIGGWLKGRRRDLGLTRDGLADCVGCSSATIEKIEMGKRRPSRQMAELLARCLEVPDEERQAFVRYARGEAASDYPAPWRAQPPERKEQDARKEADVADVV